MMSITTITPRPTRRALARGVAWSAPAMALGAMAPMAAASQCVSGRYTMNWTTGETTVDTQESLGTTRCVGGAKNYRDQVTEYPANWPTFSTVIDTTRNGTLASYPSPDSGAATDSVVCVPGIDYPASGTLCADNLASTDCSTRNGANLFPQGTTPANTAWTWSTNYSTVFTSAANSAIGLGWSNLNGTSTTNHSCWTFTFSCPLSNLKFAFHDIDYGNTVNNPGGDTRGDGRRENIYLTSGSTYTATAGSQVGGSGTASDPWYSLTNGDIGANDKNGGVLVEFTQAVSSFTICAWSAATTYRTSENIYLSPLVFDCTATCP